MNPYLQLMKPYSHYEVAYTSYMHAYYTQQNGGIGVGLYTGRQTLHSLHDCENWIVTGACILEIQICLQVLVHDWKPRKDLKDIECFNCHQKGHYASNCPSNALLCGEKGPGKVTKWMSTGTELTRKGAVEGRAVDNILLDTGCSRTLVHQELVPRGKMLEGEAVAIRCAHGDTVLYPLASLQVVVGTKSIQVRAAVLETLQVDVPLGTDVPELSELLHTVPCADAMAVVTQGQRQQMLAEEEETHQKEQESGACSTGIDEASEWMSRLDDDLFEGGQTKARESRAQKHTEQRSYAKDMAGADDQTLEEDVESEMSHPLGISAEQ